MPCIGLATLRCSHLEHGWMSSTAQLAKCVCVVHAIHAPVCPSPSLPCFPDLLALPACDADKVRCCACMPCCDTLASPSTCTCALVPALHPGWSSLHTRSKLLCVLPFWTAIHLPALVHCLTLPHAFSPLVSACRSSSLPSCAAVPSRSRSLHSCLGRRSSSPPPCTPSFTRSRSRWRSAMRRRCCRARWPTCR